MFPLKYRSPTKMVHCWGRKKKIIQGLLVLVIHFFQSCSDFWEGTNPNHQTRGCERPVALHQLIRGRLMAVFVLPDLDQPLFTFCNLRLILTVFRWLGCHADAIRVIWSSANGPIKRYLLLILTEINDLASHCISKLCYGRSKLSC